MNMYRAKSTDIPKLLPLTDDGMTAQFAGERGEIIQFLIQNIDSGGNGIAVWIAQDDDNKVIGYIIAFNSVVSPIATHAMIAHIYSQHDTDLINNLIGVVGKWAIEIGADKIQIATRIPELFARFGFKSSDEIIMERNCELVR
jgi:hypothetical protein